MATATAALALEQVAATLRDKRAALEALQRELETATQEAESLKALREKFLVPASAGDKAAIAHVEEIEQKQLVVSRKIEGLQLRLQTADREFHEVEAEHIRLSREAAEARAAVRAKEIHDEAMRLAHNVQALYRQACRAEYDLSEYLRANVEFGAELSERQKSAIVTAVRERLVVIVVNEAWTQSHCNFGQANLMLRNACPPDSLKHLEKLL
jgi:hypothetical protein